MHIQNIIRNIVEISADPERALMWKGSTDKTFREFRLLPVGQKLRSSNSSQKLEQCQGVKPVPTLRVQRNFVVLKHCRVESIFCIYCICWWLFMWDFLSCRPHNTFSKAVLVNVSEGEKVKLCNWKYIYIFFWNVWTF